MHSAPFPVVCVLTAFGLAVLLSVSYAVSPLSKSADRPLIAWQDRSAVARGQTLYAAQCASCHGARGEGQIERPAGMPLSTPLAPPHDGTGHTWQHPDFALFQLTKTGLSTVACRTLDEAAMPRFGEALSDGEILDILAYIKSRWPDDVLAEQEATNALYAAHNSALRKQLMSGSQAAR